MLATTIHKSNTTPHHQSRATTTNPLTGAPPPTTGRKTATYLRFPTLQDEEIAGLLSQSPIVCLAIPSPQNPIRKLNPVAAQRLSCTDRTPTTGPGTDIPTALIPHSWGRGKEMVLLRKEVIQPHLPVRLPCYDFVPIADPTFDGSLHKG